MVPSAHGAAIVEVMILALTAERKAGSGRTRRTLKPFVSDVTCARSRSALTMCTQSNDSPNTLEDMVTRTEKKAETHRRIVEVARRQYVARGSRHFRTAEVAQEARVSHGTIFVHFPTRDELVRAVVAEIGLDLTSRLYFLDRGEAPLVDALKAHVEALAGVEADYRRLLVEEPAMSNEERAPFIGVQSAISSHMARVAQREITAGRMREMAPHLFFNTWVGLINHYVLHPHLFAPGGNVLSTTGAELVTHFVSLVSAMNEPHSKMRRKQGERS